VADGVQSHPAQIRTPKDQVVNDQDQERQARTRVPSPASHPHPPESGLLPSQTGIPGKLPGWERTVGTQWQGNSR
jgi:hypothetical protein